MNTIILVIILLVKKPINADYSALTEEMVQILNYLNLKLVIESEL